MSRFRPTIPPAWSPRPISSPRRVVPSRRAFLRGASTALALPFLHSALPRAAWSEPVEAPRRLLFYFLPNGIELGNWKPTTEGSGFALPPLLASLVNVKPWVNVLSGLDQVPAEDDQPGDHARGTGSFLTCVPVRKTAGSDIENGVSVDQVAAQALGAETIFPSLQVGITGGGNTGDCTAGYSCAYTRNISWAAPATPLPNVTDPAVLFDRLFGGDPTLTPEEAARRTVLRASILDDVLEDADRLYGRIGKSDQEKLDEYLTGVRELESRIQALGGGACEAGGRPADLLAYPDEVRIMTDLMVTAFRCDLTRIMTFMLGNAASNQAFDFIGVPGAHHQISHHQDDPKNLADLDTIATWEVEQFAYLCEQLAAIPEGEGTVLDNSLLYLSSEIQDGDKHDHRDLPTLLVGGGGGEVEGDRHLAYGGAPMSELFVSMLQNFGVDTETFGADGFGPLPDLLG